MRKKNLVIGEEYGITVEGVPMRAKLLRVGEYEHTMELTVAPERKPRTRYAWRPNMYELTVAPERKPRTRYAWRPNIYEVGARITVTSVSIKFPMTIVIKEEDDEPAWV